MDSRFVNFGGSSHRHFGIGTVAACLCAMSTIAGCSNEDNAGALATGVVRLDGQPEPNVLVNFTPINGGSSAFATSGSDGRFEVRTSASLVGLAPGEYIVTAERFSDDGDELSEFADGETGGDPGETAGDESEVADDSATDDGPERTAENATGAGKPIPAKYLSTETSDIKVTVSESGPNDFTIELSSSEEG